MTGIERMARFCLQSILTIPRLEMIRKIFMVAAGHTPASQYASTGMCPRLMTEPTDEEVQRYRHKKSHGAMR